MGDLVFLKVSPMRGVVRFVGTHVPFLKTEGLFFRDRDRAPLFTRVVGGAVWPPRSPRGGLDLMQRLRYLMNGYDHVTITGANLTSTS